MIVEIMKVPVVVIVDIIGWKATEVCWDNSKACLPDKLSKCGLHT